MRAHIEDRCTRIADYLIETKGTVRQAAKNFNVSKTTVHMDMTVRLPIINKALYGQVRTVLDTNKAERHLRGGDATRRKFSRR